MTKGLKLTTVAIAALFVFAFGAVVLPSAYADETTTFDVTGTVTDEASLACSPDAVLGAVPGITDDLQMISSTNTTCTLTNSNAAGWDLLIKGAAGFTATDQLRLNGTGTYASHNAFTQYQAAGSAPTADWVDPNDTAYIAFHPMTAGTDNIDAAFLYSTAGGTCGAGADANTNHCWAAIPGNAETARTVSGNNTSAPTDNDTVLEFAYGKENYWLTASLAANDYSMTLQADMVLR